MHPARYSDGTHANSTPARHRHDFARAWPHHRSRAGTWNRERRVIARLEHTARGANPRFVVTSLAGDGMALYDMLYCARGDMENRIKEQFELFSDRTSAHRWWPNQFRLLLASLAYVLMTAIRRFGLAGHRGRPRPGRHDPPALAQDRRRRHPQHPSGPLPALLGLSRSGPVHTGRHQARTRIAAAPSVPYTIPMPCRGNQ